MAHKKGKRTPEAHWFVLARCLVLLRRIQRGPDKKRALMTHVQQVLGEEAYAEIGSKAANRRFENDKTRLRDRLGIALGYSKEAGGYVIRETERPLLDIAKEHLETLAFLTDTFQAGSPHAPQVQALIDTLLRRLGPDRRRVYERLRGKAPRRPERRARPPRINPGTLPAGSRRAILSTAVSISGSDRTDSCCISSDRAIWRKL
jgi:hypothetical protein